MEAEEVRRVSRTVKRPLFVYGSPPSSVAQCYGYLFPLFYLPSFLPTYLALSYVTSVVSTFSPHSLSLLRPLSLSLSLEALSTLSWRPLNVLRSCVFGNYVFHVASIACG